jgi:hypothetical protein
MNNKYALLTSRVAWILLIFLSACSANRKSRISPPDRSLDIPFETYRFHADSGLNIRTGTGTQITIAPGTLVDAKGNKASGQIEFRLREFHRPEDFLRAGIPLDTRANGDQRLQSAGMMEMRAFSGQEELRIAEGKTIGVGLAGYRDSKGYDLWYMEDDADWNVRGNFRTDSNVVKWQTIRSLSDSLEAPKVPGKEGDRNFELVGNVKSAPYLKAYQNVMWRLADSEPNSSLITDSRIHWQGVGIKLINKKKNLYELTFSQFDSDDPTVSKGIQKKILASPLLSKREMKDRAEEYEREMIAFEKQKKERMEQLIRSQKEADLIQFFAADRLGIWNVDRLMKMEECTPVVVHFDFEKQTPTKENKITIVALYDGENSVMQYNRENGNEIYLQKGKAMRLIALLPKEKVALVDNDAIQQSLATGSKEITFQTKQMSLRSFLMPQP